MSSVGAIITVVVTSAGILLKVYLQYFAPSETIIAKIISKRGRGTVGRSAFFVTMRTQYAEIECVIKKANWDKARPGEFAKVTVEFT